MSLINQMLKDLETRALKTRPSSEALSGLAPTALKKQKWLKIVLLSLGLLLFILIWTWNASHFYHRYYQKNRTAHPEKVQSAVSKGSKGSQAQQQEWTKKALVLTTVKPLVLPEAANEVQPKAALTGVSMQVHGKLTALRFLLDREATYEVDSDPLQQKLTLSLKKTRVAVNTPPLDFQNSALTALQINNTNPEELSIVFDLKPETRLSNIEMNKESNTPELWVDFILDPKPSEALKEKEVHPNPVEKTAVMLNKIPAALTPEESYQEALAWAEQGELDKAIQSLARLLDKEPDYAEARESLMSLLLKAGEQSKTEALLAEGLRLRPHYPAFIQFRAQLLVDEGKTAEALRLLKKAPPALATHPDYYAFMAALYQREGQLNAAESLYQQLTAQHPERGAWWLGLGVTEEGLGKTAQAMEAYNRADRSADLDPELRGYVGVRLRG